MRRPWGRESGVAGVVGAVLSFLLAAACATGSGAGVQTVPAEADTVASEDRAVRIVVENRSRQTVSAVVYLVTDGGSRHRLGRAQPGREEVFRYEPRQGELGRRFHLEAETNSGNLFRSDSFTFAYVGELRWLIRD